MFTNNFLRSCVPSVADKDKSLRQLQGVQCLYNAKGTFLIDALDLAANQSCDNHRNEELGGRERDENELSALEKVFGIIKRIRIQAMEKNKTLYLRKTSRNELMDGLGLTGDEVNMVVRDRYESAQLASIDIGEKKNIIQSPPERSFYDMVWRRLLTKHNVIWTNPPIIQGYKDIKAPESLNSYCNNPNDLQKAAKEFQLIEDYFADPIETDRMCKFTTRGELKEIGLTDEEIRQVAEERNHKLVIRQTPDEAFFQTIEDRLPNTGTAFGKRLISPESKEQLRRIRAFFENPFLNVGEQWRNKDGEYFNPEPELVESMDAFIRNLKGRIEMLKSAITKQDQVLDF